MKKKYIVIISISLSLLIVIISVSFFVWKFHNLSISKTISDWGALGDYFNFIVSLINLVVFLFIAIEASRFNKQSFINSMEAEKISLQTSLREASISSLSKMLDIIPIHDLQVKEFNKFKTILTRVDRDFDTFKCSKRSLFKDDMIVQEKIAQLDSSIRELINAANDSFYDKLSAFSYSSAELIRVLSEYTHREIEQGFKEPK